MKPWNIGPVDVIDWMCQEHDNCYETVQKNLVTRGCLIIIWTGLNIKIDTVQKVYKL